MEDSARPSLGDNNPIVVDFGGTPAFAPTSVVPVPTATTQPDAFAKSMGKTILGVFVVIAVIVVAAVVFTK